MATQENLPALIESLSDEFFSKSSRIRNLIGDRHWPSDGRLKEEIVRYLFRPYLAPTIDVTTGFIRNTTTPLRISREIDVLISDRSLSPPLLNEPWLSIVTPPSVRGHVQIKSAFSDSSFKEAFECLCSATRAIGTAATREQVFSAMVFCSPTQLELNALTEKALKWLAAGIRKHFNGASLIRKEVQVPNVICIFGQAILYANFADDPEPNQLTISAFECPKLVPGLLLSEIATHLVSTDRGYQPYVSLASCLNTIDCSRVQKTKQL